MSDPIFLGASPEELRESVRNLYRERDQVRAELTEKARLLETANKAMERLKRAVAGYVEGPMEHHMRACSCSWCDLDRAMKGSLDFRDKDYEKLIELNAHLLSSKAGLELQNDVFLTALENIRDHINLSLLEQFGEETFTTDQRAKALNRALKYAHDAIKQAGKPVIEKRERRGMVWRACPEHRQNEKVPFRWGPPPWHPCPNCEYRNVIESHETGPETFTEKQERDLCPVLRYEPPQPCRLPQPCPLHDMILDEHNPTDPSDGGLAT